MDFDTWFEANGYDEERREMFGVIWSACTAGGEPPDLLHDALLRKDAERYRWLRSTNNDWWDAGLVKLYHGPEFERLEGELLDAKVDAAMATAPAVGAA